MSLTRKRGKVTAALARFEKAEVNNQVGQQIRKYVDKTSETKYVTVTSSTTYDTAGAVATLSTIAQADTDTGRSGDQVRVKRLRIKGTWYLADTTNACRIVVFRYKSQGTPTTVAAFQLTSDVMAPFSTAPTHDYRKNVVILLDRLSVLDTYHPTDTFEYDIPLDFPIQFVAASSTTSTNAVYIAAITDSGAATHPTLSFYSKLEYKDY
jgi:hypothetical protein